MRTKEQIAQELDRIATAPSQYPAWAIRNAMNDAAYALCRPIDLSDRIRVAQQLEKVVRLLREAEYFDTTIVKGHPRVSLDMGVAAQILKELQS